MPPFLDHLPPGLRPYARLARVDKPIGTWLLLIPCWWGLALAANGASALWFALLFAAGALVMRAAGCTVNDLWDRKLDARVERTRTRPLASGEISVPQVLAFLVLLLLTGLAVLLQFNRLTAILGIASLALVATYPLMKRITWWPQLVLGFTFNWGVLLGWAAVKDNLGLAPLLFYAAGIFWTLGYDTIYAHQDIRDDEIIGVKSTARLFGERSLPWVASFYTFALVLMALGGWAAGLGAGFRIGLIAAAAYAFVLLAGWRLDDPASCLKRFRMNRDFGFIVLAGILLGRFL